MRLKIGGLLPYRINGMLTTLLSDFSGWYYSEELKLVRSLGYTVKVKFGYHWVEKGKIFNNFIDKFFKMKVDGE